MLKLKTELLSVIDAVAAEKNIAKSTIINILEDIFTEEIRKIFYDKGEVVAKIDLSSGDITYSCKKIIKPKSTNISEISIEEAIKIKPNAEIDDVLFLPLPDFPNDLLNKSNVKRELIYRIHSAKKELEYNEFKDKEGENIVGVVKKVDQKSLIVRVGNDGEAIIFRNGLLKTDNYKQGDKIKAYIEKVERSNKNAQIVLSRTNNNFLAMLIAESVVEVQENQITIQAISRQCGVKSKVAVYSNDGMIDAVGACVGARGSRIKVVMDELKGEKIDILRYDRDIVNFAKNAITPAKASYGSVINNGESVELVIPDDQLLYAIGKGGCNVRLASQLIGCNITIVSESDKKQQMHEKFENDVKLICSALDVEEQVAQFLVSSNIYTPEDLVELGSEKLIKSGVFNEEIAQELIQRANEYIVKKNEMEVHELEELGISTDILKLNGMNNEVAIILGKNNIKTVQDIADLSSDEFIEICGEKYGEVATPIIMSARKIAYNIN